MESELEKNNSQQKVNVSGNTIHLTNGTLQIQTIVQAEGGSNGTLDANQFRWQQCYSSESLPLDAVLAGYDTNEDPIFVGQAHHMGNLLPAKVIPNKKCAYVSHDGEEFQKSSFQVLCCRNVSWVLPQNGSIPPNAIPGGRTTSGEELFIGRGKFNGSLTPGKLFPNDRKLYIPYGNCEVVMKHFEVLVTHEN